MLGKLMLAVCAGCALAPVALGAPAAKRPAKITISDRQVASARIDLGRRGPSLGDLLTRRALLYNKSITERPIGHSEAVCVATDDRSSMCTVTFFLPMGRIVVSAAGRSSDFSDGAIIGGTGLYARVRGTLTVTLLANKPMRHLLVFRLPVR